MKTAIFQMNPTVGDLRGNAERIYQAYREAAENGAELLITPECSLTGYPLEDLVLRKSFMEGVEAEFNRLVDEIVELKKSTVLIVGRPSWANAAQASVTNSAYVIDPTIRTQRVNKVELPNYGVFDEKRHFVGGDLRDVKPVNIHGRQIGLMICEDCWFPQVSQTLSEQGASLLISINGSPFEAGKNITRRQVIANRIKEVGLPFLYVNMVGGQDELLFDGGSFYYDERGIQEAPHFDAGMFYFDIDPAYSDEPNYHLVTTDNYPKLTNTSAGVNQVIYQAAVLGLRDYLGKQGFKSVVLGYSGGVDSGLVAALACDAIGAENVHLVRLPSKYSSDGSLTDAAEGAKRLGAPMRTNRIEPVVEALRATYETTEYHYEQDSSVLSGTADENIQARARGVILMAISNQEGHLLLTTGNKSEVSVGYSTLYGDMSGGYNPIKDCYKTTVWELCRWRNALDQEAIDAFEFLGRVGDVVPEAIISKPPSAELRPDQKDTDSLPPYPVLDAILDGMIERELSSVEIVAEGIADIDTVRRIRRLVDMAEYKRRQAAPGIKTTSKIYGRDRRYPIVNAWRG